VRVNFGFYVALKLSCVQFWTTQADSIRTITAGLRKPRTKRVRALTIKKVLRLAKEGCKNPGVFFFHLFIGCIHDKLKETNHLHVGEYIE
jgi:hypothetical protein